MTEAVYCAEAIGRARDDALEWLDGHTDGYPRAKATMAEDDRHGYDQFQASPIYGYEALEAEGIVVRLDDLDVRGERRSHFRRVGATPPYTPSQE